ncbi:hypothetical protein ABPG74_005356 [Tetrahymena malaccensis]
MIQSKLFRAADLNEEKKKYLHDDCKPIVCDKSQIISYWESLSLHEKEKIFMVYDLNIIDELVEILNIARTRIASTEFERKSGQIIKMPEKTILLEYLYFDALEIYFKEEFLTKKFIKSLCLIFNKVTNDVYQKYLEDLNIPQCTDSCLIQAKKKVLKFKIKSLISILDVLDVFVDSFCNGEKVIIKKRHYSNLYKQLVKNPLTKNPSSDEIRQKIRETTELLSVMLENNLIKAYKKATKYYSKAKKEKYKNQSSSSSAKVSIIIQHQSNVSNTNTNQPNLQPEKVKLEENKENNSNFNITENQSTKEELLQSKKTQQQIIPNRNLQEISDEKEEKVVINQVKVDEQIDVVNKIQSEVTEVEQNNQNQQQSSDSIQKVSEQETQKVHSSQQFEQEYIENKSQIEESKKELQRESENNMAAGGNVISESANNNTANKLSINKDDTNLKDESSSLANNNNDINQIKDENADNIKVQNKKSQDYQNISYSEILNKQKNECMMEIENQDIYQFEDEEDKYQFSSSKKNNKIFQEDGFYHDIDDNHIGSYSSSPQFAKLSQDEIDQDNSDNKKCSNKKRNVKKYLQSEVEPISKKLCMVNLNSLIIKLDNYENDDQTSIFDSDEEYYEPDEKENFHYNQELKDYDIVDVLGDSFKFDPKFCLSKDKINQLLLQSQQSQQQFYTHSTIASNMQIPQHQPPISSSGKKQQNQNYNNLKSIYSDDSNDESQYNDNYSNKGKYYGHNNVHNGRQQPQQNFMMQDQMHQMMHNYPFPMHTNQYAHLYFLLNQNMINPQQQMPQQNNKYKSSNKHPRNTNNNNSSNQMNNQVNSSNHVIHMNPNNLVSSNRKNNQQSSDYHGNQLISNNINNSQNPNGNGGQYSYSNKGQRNNNNPSSNSNQQSHSSHNSGQGFRNKKRYNTKANNQ